MPPFLRNISWEPVIVAENARNIIHGTGKVRGIVIGWEVQSPDYM